MVYPVVNKFNGLCYSPNSYAIYEQIKNDGKEVVYIPSKMFRIKLIYNHHWYS